MREAKRSRCKKSLAFDPDFRESAVCHDYTSHEHRVFRNGPPSKAGLCFCGLGVFGISCFGSFFSHKSQIQLAIKS